MAPAVPVGVAEHVVDTGDLTTQPCADGSTPLFIGAIMHCAVSTRGFNATVRVDATPEQIARALCGRVTVDRVRHVWLADGFDDTMPPANEQLESSTRCVNHQGQHVTTSNSIPTVTYHYHTRADVPRYNPNEARIFADTRHQTENTRHCRTSDIQEPCYNNTIPVRGTSRNVSVCAPPASEPLQFLEKSEDECEIYSDVADTSRNSRRKKSTSDSPRLSSSLSSSVTDGAAASSPPVPLVETVAQHDYEGTLSTSNATSPVHHQVGSTASSSKSALGRGHFEELFVDKPKMDEACIAFVTTLIAKLTDIAGNSSGSSSSGSLHNITSQGVSSTGIGLSSRRHPRTSRYASSPSPTTGEDGGLVSDELCGCGFGDAHEAINILCDGFAICKAGKGIYRTALGCSPVRPRSKRQAKYYFEVHVVEDCGGDGMCIGLTSPLLRLNQLIGSDTYSVGLHSSGKLVTGNGSNANFMDYADVGFKKNDRVGCKVVFASKESAKAEGPGAPPSSLAESLDVPADVPYSGVGDASEWADVEFFVNGKSYGAKPLPLFSGLPLSQRKLYPAVSLFRTNSKAVMRCCREDWERPDDCEKLRGVVSVCTGR